MVDSGYHAAGVQPSALDSEQRPPSDPLDSLVSRSAYAPRSSALHPVSGALNLPLSEEGKRAMTRSVQEIFDMEEEQKEDVEMGDRGDEEEEIVDLEDQSRRTEKLKSVLSTLGQLWSSGSEHMDLVAEKLGDGSRDRELDLSTRHELAAFLSSFSILRLNAVHSPSQMISCWPMPYVLIPLTPFSKMACTSRRFRGSRLFP